ncbi:hypothetical protein [Pseudomonas phage vB_PseuGesM_254]|uniref:Uncharacterized protein n=1 Tax=Pseudomonas phage vB_PseuGesM_254 TaxID=3092638 RepID=A0AAX4G6D5_9CAUD|nr:hypothetical protein [Pseudomonas phage PseuGes_254]
MLSNQTHQTVCTRIELVAVISHIWWEVMESNHISSARRLQRPSCPSNWSTPLNLLGTSQSPPVASPVDQILSYLGFGWTSGNRTQQTPVKSRIPIADRSRSNCLAGNRGLEPPICWLTASDPRPVRTLPKSCFVNHVEH